MFKLVWKDFLILRKVLWYAPIYSFIMAFAFSNTSAGALSASTIVVSYMLMIQACARDEKNKSEIMLNSLPLRRRDIVLAKYLSVFPYAILGILSYLLTQGAVSVTGIPITTLSFMFTVSIPEVFWYDCIDPFSIIKRFWLRLQMSYGYDILG